MLMKLRFIASLLLLLALFLPLSKCEMPKNKPTEEATHDTVMVYVANKETIETFLSGKKPFSVKATIQTLLPAFLFALPFLLILYRCLDSGSSVVSPNVLHDFFTLLSALALAVIMGLYQAYTVLLWSGWLSVVGVSLLIVLSLYSLIARIKQR